MDIVTDLSISAPKRCADSVEGETGATLRLFPLREEGESARINHVKAWAAYEECLARSDLFTFMRSETNRICGVEDIGPALERNQFVCACHRTPPEEAACSQTPAIAQPRVLPSVARPTPEMRMGRDGVYGPSLLGIRLGMPITEAVAIIRTHMRVGREYAAGNMTQLGEDEYRSKKPLTGRQFMQKLTGHLFVSEDEQEFVVLAENNQFTGRVVMAGWGAFLPAGAEKQAFANMVAEHGDPTEGGPKSLRTFWGDGLVFPGCAGSPRAGDHFLWKSNGRAMENRAPVFIMPWEFNLRARDDLFKCGPILAFEHAGTGGSGPRPVNIVIRLYDVGLLAWIDEGGG